MDKVKMYTLLLFAVCALCLAGAAAARAEDFTFTVPVHLKALDATVKIVGVVCSLDTGQGSQIDLTPDTNGNVDQNVVVKFNAPPAPSKVKTYVCGLILRGDGGLWCDFRLGNTPQGAACATKGSFTGVVSGNITSQ